MVFDMIANAPGVLNSTAAVGAAPGPHGRGRRSQPDTRPEPDRLRLQAAEGLRLERRRAAQAVGTLIILDLAYVGSSSKDLLRQAQINARAARRHVPAAEPGPDDASTSTTPGATALPTDLLRPYQGYGAIRMWDYSATPTTTRCRPRSTAASTTGSCSRSSTCGARRWAIGNDDFTRACPNASEEEIKRVDYSYAELRPPAQLRAQLRLPDAQGRERRPRRAGERLADLGHLPLDERPAVRDRLLDPGRRRTRTSPAATPTRRPRRGHVRPGRRLEQRPVQADQHRVLRPAAARQRRHRVGPLLPVRRRRSTTSTCRSPRSSRSARG